MDKKLIDDIIEAVKELLRISDSDFGIDYAGSGHKSHITHQPHVLGDMFILDIAVAGKRNILVEECEVSVGGEWNDMCRLTDGENITYVSSNPSAIAAVMVFG